MLHIKIFSSLLIFIIFLAGCAQNQPAVLSVPAATPVPAPSPEIILEPKPQTGGALRVAMRLPKTLNPLLNEDTSVDTVLRLVFEPLVELDSRLRPSNNLASNINHASDGMSIIITLANGLKWADDKPITAFDIEYSLDVLKSAPERAIYKESVRNIAEYSVMDDLNIRISYLKPLGGANYLLNFPIIPKHFYANTPDVADVNLGNGLYKFSRFEKQEYMVLEASKNAFGKRPYISEIYALITSDYATDLHAFEQDLIDIVNADISYWGRLANNKPLNAYSYPTTYFDFIAFNFANDMFRDPKMRQAFAHAIDKDRLLHDVYLESGGVKADAPISALSWLYEPNTTSYEFDPAKASELLDSTGARVIRVLVNEENEERVKVANMLSESLNQSGVSLVIERESFNEFERRLTIGDFDLAIVGFYLSTLPDLSFAFGTGGERNYFSYSNPDMDGLLDAMYSVRNESAYRRASSDLQKLFAEELPCVSLVFRNSVVLTSDRVRGAQQPTITNPFAGMEQWFIYE